MAERYERPAWVKRLNAMADAVGGAHAVVPLDPEELRARVEVALGGAPAHEGTELLHGLLQRRRSG